MNRDCRLCHGSNTRRFFEEASRIYWRCDDCHLTFLDPSDHLDADHEYAHYLTHENDVEDPGYRAFLARLADPLLERLQPSASGLDYGCGPGPALAYMLREAGHQVALYDPFFHNDREALDLTYDFITCTEVAEHFHDPVPEFARFNGLLRPGGVLGIMTSFQTDDDRFPGWHYRKDPTHVVFYRRETFAWIADHFGWACEIPAKDIVIMKKPQDVETGL